MSAHTPGPWVVADDVVFQVRAHNQQMLVAEVRGWGWLTGGGGLALSDEEAEKIQKANARLIAAAPELLDALKNLEAACAAVASWSDDCLDFSDATRVAARAAIAKAEGER